MVVEDQFPTYKKILWLLKKEKVKLDDKQQEYLRECVLFEIQDRLAKTNISATSATYTRYLKKHFPEEWDDENSVKDTPFNINIDFKNESENKI